MVLDVITLPVLLLTIVKYYDTRWVNAFICKPHTMWSATMREVHWKAMEDDEEIYGFRPRRGLKIC